MTGFHFLVFATSPSADSQPPHLLVGPITSEPSVQSKRTEVDPDPAHSLSTIRIEVPHSVGPLVGLSGVVLGIRNCADDLLAFDSMGAVVCSLLFASHARRRS